ncbi:pseudouridine synthase [Chloroflexota bacterium]
MESKKENLLGILIEARIASRRKLAAAIMEGRVTVNGKMITNLRHPINAVKDSITLNGQAVVLKPKQYVYIMLNKPDGVFSTVSDERGRPTVIDYIPQKYRHLRLYPVGRLDKDTKGLLLLTNDGDLTYRLTHPGFENEKEYLMSINGELKPGELKKLEKGVRLEDGMTVPAKVKEVENSPPFNYSLTIHEGRKRQVRRMFEVLGYRVLALKRVRLGKLTLGNLKEGEVKELMGEEIKQL